MQIEYLSALGVADLTDELALEFGDAYLPRVELLEAIAPQAAAACREIDQWLSSDQLGWSFTDLESATWARVRERAAAAWTELERSSEIGPRRFSRMPNQPYTRPK